MVKYGPPNTIRRIKYFLHNLYRKNLNSSFNFSSLIQMKYAEVNIKFVYAITWIKIRSWKCNNKTINPQTLVVLKPCIRKTHWIYVYDLLYIGIVWLHIYELSVGILRLISFFIRLGNGAVCNIAKGNQLSNHSKQKAKYSPFSKRK